MLPVQVGRADLDELHRQLARQEARQRHLELRIGEEEDPLALERRRDGGRAPARARSRPGADDRAGSAAGRRRRRRPPPAARPSCPRRRAGRAPAGAWRRALPARARCRRGRAGPAGSGCAARPAADRAARRGGKKSDRSMPSSANSRANWSSTTSGSAPTTSSGGAAVGARRGQLRHQRGEAGVLALGEGRLDAAAGIVQDPHRGRVASATGAARRATGRA